MKTTFTAQAAEIAEQEPLECIHQPSDRQLIVRRALESLRVLSVQGF
jgi:hypothetical protein